MSGIPPEVVTRAFEQLQLERPRIRARDFADACAKLDAWKADTVKPTWRRAVRAVHPDFGRDDADRAKRTEQVKALNAAYEVVLRVRIRSNEEREAAARATVRRAETANKAVQRRAAHPRYGPPPPAPPTPPRPPRTFEDAFAQRVMAALLRSPSMMMGPPPPPVPWVAPQPPCRAPRASAVMGLFQMVAANGYYGRFW